MESRKHILGYGITNIHGSQNCSKVKLYRGKLAFGYSHNAFGLMIKKKECQCINTEDWGDEFCIDFAWKDLWISWTNIQSIKNMNHEILHTHSKHEENKMAI